MEPSKEEAALLDRMSVEVFGIIQCDLGRVSPTIKPLLLYLAQHLFDQDLNAQRWFRACKVRSNSARTIFRKELRCSPHHYYTRLRMTVAQRLLKNTSLKVWRIAELLGYDSGSFRSTVKRWLGKPPTAIREQLPKQRTEIMGADDGMVVWMQQWRKALTGAAEHSLQKKLAQELRKMRTESGKGSQPECQGDLAANADFFEQLEAEDFWAEIQALSLREQEDLIRYQVSFQTTALFDILRRKSIDEGRKDRKRGVDLARLALLSLDPIAERLGADIHNRRTQGWARLGHALRLALDPLLAEQAIAYGEVEWAAPRHYRDPVAQVELLQSKAALRWFQRRFQEAIDLSDQAIHILSTDSQPELLAQALVGRACIQDHAGKSDQAVAGLREALRFINEFDQPNLTVSVYANLAKILLKDGTIEAAESVLAKATKLSEDLGIRLVECQIKCLYSQIERRKGRCENAAKLLLEVQGVLEELGETEENAVATIELAIVYAELGRNSDAVLQLSRAISLLEALRIYPEALGALNLLHEAVHSRNTDRGLLREIRTAVGEITRARCSIE